jgi:arsenate reductase
MTLVTIYHNPRCSKSRQTLALLEARDLELRIVSYLESPPSKNELANIVKMLGVAAAGIVRNHEDEYKDSGLTVNSSENDILDALLTKAKLMQRPIVVCRNQARVGRPPASVLKIL